MKRQLTGTIIFYSTPAYGHVNPVLPVLRELSESGCRVIFYGTEEFRPAAESVRAEFIEYELGDIVFDTTVGSRLLELTELIQRFTLRVLDGLLHCAGELSPDLIIFDTLAFWGRAVSEILHISSVSINTIITVPSVFSRAFLMYTMRFSAGCVRELKFLPSVWQNNRIIKRRYKITKAALLDILMNKAELNVYTYPGLLHPDKSRMTGRDFFLGPSSLLRETTFSDPDDYDYKNMIYVSLGTVFNSSEKFWQGIIKEFSGTDFTVIISSSLLFDKQDKYDLTENIIIKKYTDQQAVMKKARLFISAGGMNSICEAAANGVPCLICPQQGEQAINAKMLQKPGLGIVIHGTEGIQKKARELTESYTADERLIREFNDIRMNELMEKLEALLNRNNA